MFDSLLQNLTTHTSLSEEEAMKVMLSFQRKTIKKNDYIYTPGDTSNQLMYINEGLIRCFYKLGKKEIILNVWKDDDWFTDYISLFHQKPTEYHIQALEDSELFVIENEKLQMLFEIGGNFEKWGYQMVDNRMKELLIRELPDKINTPEEHYKIFLQKHPKIVAKTPVKYLASLINIEPETLSRIRNKIAKE